MTIRLTPSRKSNWCCIGIDYPGGEKDVALSFRDNEKQSRR